MQRGRGPVLTEMKTDSVICTVSPLSKLLVLPVTVGGTDTSPGTSFLLTGQPVASSNFFCQFRPSCVPFSHHPLPLTATTPKNPEFYLCPQYLTFLLIFHTNIRFILLRHNFDYVTSLFKKPLFLIELFQLINRKGMLEYHHFAILNEIMYLALINLKSLDKELKGSLIMRVSGRHLNPLIGFSRTKKKKGQSTS